MNILAEATNQLIEVIDTTNTKEPANAFKVNKIISEIDFSGNPWRGDPNNFWVVKAFNWEGRVYPIAIYVNIERNETIADGY